MRTRPPSVSLAGSRSRAQGGDGADSGVLPPVIRRGRSARAPAGDGERHGMRRHAGRRGAGRDRGGRQRRLVPVDDARALTETLGELLSSPGPAATTGEAARTRVAETHGIDVVVGALSPSTSRSAIHRRGRDDSRQYGTGIAAPAPRVVGLDPFDALRGSRVPRWVKRNRPARQALIQLRKRCPLDLAPLLGVRPFAMAKAVATFLTAAARTAGSEGSVPRRHTRPLGATCRDAACRRGESRRGSVGVRVRRPDPLGVLPLRYSQRDRHCVRRERALRGRLGLR